MTSQQIRTAALAFARSIGRSEIATTTWSEAMKRGWAMAKEMAAEIANGMVILFKKADGTAREMFCQRLTYQNFDGTGTGRKTPSGNISVWEILPDGSKQVRSFKINNLLTARVA